MRARVSARQLAGLVVTGLLLWGLYASIEFYQEEAKTGWSLEAYRNPYLAAQQFMSRSGIEVIDAGSLAKLDTLQGVSTLFITDASQIISPRQLQQVLTWLENGGNVIVTADSVANTDDLLLQAFDVEVTLREYDADDQAESKSMSESFREYNRQIEQGKTRDEIVKMYGKDTTLTLVQFDDEIGEVEIDFESARILTHPYIDGKGYDAAKPRPDSWSASEHGIHLMQFDVGSGLLTMVSDSTIWTSYRIEAYDHAYLLWILSSRGGDFAILYPQLRDSLWQLAIRHASELLIAVALLVAFWLWHMGRRFGRILPPELTGARAMGEHFTAISQYLWHRKRGLDLIAPLRQRVLRRASLSLGEFAGAAPHRQMELIGKRCGVTTDSISRALQETQFNETSFVDTVKLLKHIEQSL